MESWALDLLDSDGVDTPMVLRRRPPQRRFSSVGLQDLAIEAALLRAAKSCGVPVPEVYFQLPAGSPAGEGYAMARIEGETVGARILKSADLAQARAGLARSCGEVLARIHAMPVKGLTGLQSLSVKEELDALYVRLDATGQDRPVFEYALRWLSANLPPEGKRTLVHGDFRNGNLVVGPEGLRAVLDWELAHIGSPLSDLGWLCVTSWRFQNPEKPVGGFGTREELLDGYCAVSGEPVDMDLLHWWEVFQTLSWGMICTDVSSNFEKGVQTVEGAMIARRASETEFDLLRLLLPDCEAWDAR